MSADKNMEAFDAIKIKPKTLLGIRHLQTVMLCLGLLLAYGMRINMSVAIVAMTDSANENAFDWSLQIQSVILSSFFWGYVVLQIPGGELAARFGGSVLMIVALTINSIVTLLVPVAAQYLGWQAVCACRVVQGLTQGFVFPSLHNLIGKWAPIDEKSRIGTVIYAGAHLGTALQMIASGFIANYWGWAAIFYVNGTLGAIWTVLYLFLGSDSPRKSKMISDAERLYIETSLGHVGKEKKYTTPWHKVFTSLPFISLIVVHGCQSWGYWTLMTLMPSYLNQVLGVDIKSNGMMSALPYLALYLLSFPFGIVCDYVLKKGYLTITTTRKLSNSVGLYGPALALIGLSYSPAGNVTLAVTLFTIVVGLNAGHTTGFMLGHIDMAPNFAGTLMGITNSMGNTVSIIAPIAAVAIIQDEEYSYWSHGPKVLYLLYIFIPYTFFDFTVSVKLPLQLQKSDSSEWRKVFYLSSAIYIFGNTFYVLFGSSERQSWNEEEVNTTEKVETPAVK